MSIKAEIRVAGRADMVLVEVPFIPGEDFATALERIATKIRDTMGIQPAKDMGDREWRALLARTTKGAK